MTNKTFNGVPVPQALALKISQHVKPGTEPNTVIVEAAQPVILGLMLDTLSLWVFTNQLQAKVIRNTGKVATLKTDDRTFKTIAAILKGGN